MASIHKFVLLGLAGFGILGTVVVPPLAGQTTFLRPPREPDRPREIRSSTAELPAVRAAIAVADLWIRERLGYFAIPGVAVAVVHGGETVWAAGYGRASLETGEPVTPS